MEDVILSYRNRSKKLGMLIAEIEKELKGAPEGKLRVENSRNNLQYYLVTESGTRGHYIKNNEKKIVPELAQKDYCLKLLKEAKREKKAIDKFIKDMNGTSPEKVFDNLNEYRKPLVTPLIISDEEYARRWQNTEYVGNPYYPEEKIYVTRRGEKVRSLAEEIIADTYDELGIPYRYEPPILLNNGEVKYPDFVVLKVSERKEIIHEHMGLLEEDEYRKKNLTKIREYAENGIILGDNFILTFATEYVPFNRNEIKKTIKSIFL